MKLREGLENRIRGWLPKTPRLAYLHKASKPRWRNPYWITLTLVIVVALASTTYMGVQTYLRYSNPQLDITGGYYEKSLNCSTASIGDIVEVNVLVYWHGYVIPEFKREVKIVDPFPENNFILVSESNVYDSSGYGGSYQFKYLLKVIGVEAEPTELPKPILYLNNIEIPLKGISPTIDVKSN